MNRSACLVALAAGACFGAACGRASSAVRPTPVGAAAAPPLSAPAATPTPPLPPPRADGRLPGGVRPTRYALDLAIDPSQPGFSGRARIGVAVAVATRGVVMHGRGM